MSVTLLRRAHLVPVFLMLCFGVQLVQAQPSGQANGNSKVQATVPAGKILLSGVGDVIFPTWDGSTGQSKTLAGICVWSTTRVYGLDITSKTGAFELASKDPAVSTDTIPFSVSWQAHSGVAARTITNYGDSLTGLEAPSKTKDCTDDPGNQASMTIAMTEADLAAAIAATYEADLTITVAAE